MPSPEELKATAAAVEEFTKGFRKLIGATTIANHVQKPGDVYIVTYPKSGTHLLSQLLYQTVVASGNGPSFDPTGEEFESIHDVVPGLEFAVFRGQDTNATVMEPRVYCTHYLPEEFEIAPEKGTKFIYCFRDIEKIPSSLLDFLTPAIMPDAFSNDAEREAFYHLFVKKVFLGLGLSDEDGRFEYKKGQVTDWHKHIMAWTDEPSENIMILAYENVCKDVRGTARRVAKFLDLQVSDEKFDTIVHRCSREYMLGDKFKLSASQGFFKGTAGSFVRPAGDTGFHAFKFDDEAKEATDAMLQEVFDVKNYAELIAKKV